MRATSDSWIATVPVLEHFSQVADESRYSAVPDDWFIGMSDVVDSTSAIGAGHYKAVNLAGAGTISAVMNALQNVRLFAFGGDGARFAVPADQAQLATKVLSRVASWAERGLGLRMRVGMVKVSESRLAGHDVHTAFWKASDDVQYAMFCGGGFEWADAKLKRGKIGLTMETDTEPPDLTGLSCQWGPIHPQNGHVVSLIVKKTEQANGACFRTAISRVIEILEKAPRLNSVPAEGPNVRWPTDANSLQARIVRHDRALIWRRFRVLASTFFVWSVFKARIRFPRFDPDQYRSAVASNTDFRKFDDALMMTVDCSEETIRKLRSVLEEAAIRRIV
jgi:hypothetical protein